MTAIFSVLLMAPLSMSVSSHGMTMGFSDAHAASDNDRSTRGGRSGRKGGSAGRRGNDRNEAGRNGASNSNSAGRPGSSSSKGSSSGRSGRSNDAANAAASPEAAEVGVTEVDQERGDAEGGDRMDNPWYDLDLDGMRTFNAHGVSETRSPRKQVLCSEFDCDWPR